MCAKNIFILFFTDSPQTGTILSKTCDSLLCKYSNRNSQKTCEILDVGKFKCYSKKHLPTLCKEGSFPRLLQVAIALDVVLISRSYQVSICHFEKEDERITASVLILCRLISRIIQIVLMVSGLGIRTTEQLSFYKNFDDLSNRQNILTLNFRPQGYSAI